jgi:hypothetical protein
MRHMGTARPCGAEEKGRNFAKDILDFGGVAGEGTTGEGAGWNTRARVCSPFLKRHEGEL